MKSRPALKLFILLHFSLIGFVPDIFALPTPEMDVQGNVMPIVDGDATPSAIDNTNFGYADIDGTMVHHTFTVSNIGTTTLNLTGVPKVTVGGTNPLDFFVAVQPAASVPAGGTTTFTVYFDPITNGTRSATIIIANDDADENPYNFSIQGTGTSRMDVHGTVFEDLNCNGLYDAGEPGISGVTVNITGPESLSTITDQGGAYVFLNLVAGTYTLTETDPPGYRSVTPNVVQVAASIENDYFIDFGDTQSSSSISGVVFVDSDSDGIQHPLDSLIPGVKIDLPISDYEHRSTITDENGWYSFHGLGGGNYTLTEADLPGYISTTPDEVQVSVCGSESYVNFGEKPDVVINRLKEGAILSAGSGHTCGVKDDRTVVCWGWNGYGQASPPAGKFKSVSAGYYHTCGIRTDGTVTCWGAGTTNTGVNFEHGQSITPSGIFSYVSAGYEHSCGLKPNGDAVCWGNFAHGQTNAPAGIFSQVSTGQFNTCGVATNGDLACWGEDYYDQGAPSLLPSGIFSEVSAGGDHACGLNIDETAVCWGWNGYGQATPPDETTFKQVSVGGDHTCGLKLDGTVTCWGSNNMGQLISPEGIFTQINAGGYHTCGEQADGTVTCWGYNGDGRTTPPSDLVLLTNVNGLPWLMLLLE